MTMIGGQREFIELMGKLGLMSGVNLLFLETYDDIEKAPCDGPTQYLLDKLKYLLTKFEKIKNFLIHN